MENTSKQILQFGTGSLRIDSMRYFKQQLKHLVERLFTRLRPQSYVNKEMKISEQFEDPTWFLVDNGTKPVKINLNTGENNMSDVRQEINDDKDS